MEKKAREKVPVKSGFHLTDWYRLLGSLSTASNATNKISNAELAKHSTQFDCWVAYKGKVYNVTQYLAYHPGGQQILLETGGTDCTVLFDKYHKWVNINNLMGKCLVGVLSEEEEKMEVVKEEVKEETSSAEIALSTLAIETSPSETLYQFIKGKCTIQHV